MNAFANCETNKGLEKAKNVTSRTQEQSLIECLWARLSCPLESIPAGQLIACRKTSGPTGQRTNAGRHRLCTLFLFTFFLCMFGFGLGWSTSWAQETQIPQAGTLHLIQGSQPGQGPDFSGDMLYAIDFGGKGGKIHGLKFTPHQKAAGLGMSSVNSATSGQPLVFATDDPAQTLFASMVRSHIWTPGRINLQLDVKQGERYRLQFFWVESQSNLSQVGKRVFGVRLDGVPWLQEIDLAAVAGAAERPLVGMRTNAVMGSGEWLATSDTLEIELASTVEKPPLGAFTMQALSPAGLQVDKQRSGGLTTVWDKNSFEEKSKWPNQEDDRISNHVTVPLKGGYPKGWQVLSGYRLGTKAGAEIAYGSPHLSALPHPTCVISSPRFRLDPSAGDLWVRLTGDSGRARLPTQLHELPAFSDDRGSLGLGLRRVSDGTYVAMTGRSSLGTGVHRIPSDVLASVIAENPEEIFRLDLVDGFHAPSGRIGLSGLWIPGQFVSGKEEQLAQQWLVYRRADGLVSSRSGVVLPTDSSISETVFNESGTAIRVVVVPENEASSVRRALEANVQARIEPGASMADSGVIFSGTVGLLQGFSGGQARADLRCIVVAAPVANQPLSVLSIPSAVSGAPVGLQSWFFKPSSGPSMTFWLEFPARHHFQPNQRLQGLVLDAPFAAEPETLAYSRDLGFTRNALRKNYVCMGWGSGIWNRHLWGVDSADLDEAELKERMKMWQTRCEETEAEVARLCETYDLPEDGWIAMADCAAMTRLTQYVSRYPHRFSTVLYEQAHTFAELNPASEHIFFGFISRKHDPYGDNSIAEFLRVKELGGPVFYQQLDGGNQDIMINTTQFDLLDYVHQTRQKLGIQFSMNASERGSFAEAVKQDLADAPWFYDIVNQETFRNENIDWLPEEQRSGLPTAAIAASVHDGRPARTTYGHKLASRVSSDSVPTSAATNGDALNFWDVGEWVNRPGMVEIVVESPASDVQGLSLFVDGKAVAEQTASANEPAFDGKGPRLKHAFHVPVLYRSETPRILVGIDSAQVSDKTTVRVRELDQHISVPFELAAGTREVVMPVDAAVAEVGRYSAAISTLVAQSPALVSAQLEFTGSGQLLAQDVHLGSPEWTAMENNVYALTVVTPYDMAESRPSLRIRFDAAASASIKGVVVIGMQRHLFHDGQF